MVQTLVERRQLTRGDAQAGHARVVCLPIHNTQVIAKHRVTQLDLAAEPMSQTVKTCVLIRP